jgi:hypothetical protein
MRQHLGDGVVVVVDVGAGGRAAPADLIFDGRNISLCQSGPENSRKVRQGDQITSGKFESLAARNVLRSRSPGTSRNSIHCERTPVADEPCREKTGSAPVKIPSQSRSASRSVELHFLHFITSQFMPRVQGDRPLVRPTGTTNIAFGELPDDVVFTVQYSVRSAQTAVYSLLDLDQEVAPYKGQHDLELLNALKTMIH